MVQLPSIADRLANELSIQARQVRAAIELFDGGATVPFVARYRKEATGGLDDVQLRSLSERLLYMRELEDRRVSILKSIEKQQQLTPELRALIESATTKTALEDLYLPFKQTRRTKATVAREAGLEPLADALLADPTLDPVKAAANFVDRDKGVDDPEAALDGARSILIERFACDAELVGRARKWIQGCADLASRVTRGKAKAPEAQRFRDYFEHAEPLSRVKGHRALAMFRGRKEGFLRMQLVVEASDGERRPLSADPTGKGQSLVCRRFDLEDRSRRADAWLLETARDCFTTKLAPHLEAELFVALRETAESEAIKVFAANLRDLLLAAPAGPRVILGIDPGLRTGCKVAVVDRTGKLLDTATIYPHVPRNDRDGALRTLASLCRSHDVDLIAIGNGTGSRETDQLATELQARVLAAGRPKIDKLVVSEAGASIYSASERGSQEFPDLDVSLRGAVSIARRLQDPLAELVKIDAKSIGVGQYQHDVNQKQLSRALDGVVEDCVNSVGVDLNTASEDLLARVAGLGSTLAKNIVEFRDQHGAFPTRKRLLKVPRLGPKAFEQSAGFLRIRDGKDPLDRSAVHPEAYPVVARILESSGRAIDQVIGDHAFLRSLDPKRFVDDRFGLPTVTDIVQELDKPGRDPRPEFETASFQDDITELTDLTPGMQLEGTVTNVTNFGAFVDVGVHQDGLVHISQLADRFVEDPRDVVKTGQVVQVRILEVDIPRKRIAMTMKRQEPAAAPSTTGENERADSKSKDGRRRPPKKRRDDSIPPSPLAEQLAKLKLRKD